MRTSERSLALRDRRRPVWPGYMVALLSILLAAGACSKPTKRDTTPPDTPASLTAVRGDARVTLTWSMVTNKDLEGYLPYYRVAAGGSPVQGDMVSTASNSTTLIGLVNGTAYVFWVTAIDEAGNESGPSPEVTETPHNQVSLTEAGWTAWEAGEYTEAESAFNDALTLVSTWADAHSGLGWTSIRTGDLPTAQTRFTSAVTYGLSTQDARVGLLVVCRDLPGQLALAAGYGEIALTADPTYVFSHDPSIDADVVRLILAQVYYRIGSTRLDDAQNLMDELMVGNGLDPLVPATWSVGGTVYPTYEGALLALIEAAFAIYAP